MTDRIAAALFWLADNLTAIRDQGGILILAAIAIGSLYVAAIAFDR